MFESDERYKDAVRKGSGIAFVGGLIGFALYGVGILLAKYVPWMEKGFAVLGGIVFLGFALAGFYVFFRDM